MKRLTILCTLMVVSIAAGAQSFDGVPAPTAAAPAVRTVGPYSSGTELAAGDLVTVLFFYSPELQVTQRVRADGSITVPLAGDVIAAGLTPAALARRIREALRSSFENLDVAIIIEEQRPRFVYVAGQVRTPGAVAMAEGMTIMQALFAAGGPLEGPATALPSRVVLMRLDGATWTRAEFEADRLLFDGAAVRDHYLRPGDVLYYYWPRR